MIPKNTEIINDTYAANATYPAITITERRARARESYVSRSRHRDVYRIWAFNRCRVAGDFVVALARGPGVLFVSRETIRASRKSPITRNGTSRQSSTIRTAGPTYLSPSTGRRRANYFPAGPPNLTFFFFFVFPP